MQETGLQRSPYLSTILCMRRRKMEVLVKVIKDLSAGAKGVDKD